MECALSVARRHSVSLCAGFAILIAFAVFLIMQHRLVFPYHDDWGLAVLDYDFVFFTGGVTPVERTHEIDVTRFVGREFSFGHAIEYFSLLYMQWSGRVLPFVIQAYVFKFGVDGARYVQVGLILCLVMASSRLITGRSAPGWAIALPIVMYLAVPLFVAARGLYWFSASTHSLWGLPLLLLGALVLQRANGSLTWSAVLLLSISALFNEMTSAVALCLVASASALALRGNKSRVTALRQLLIGAPVFVAAALVVLAPGNFARAAQSRFPGSSAVESAIFNLGSVGQLVMQNPAGRSYLAIWAVGLAALACLVWLRRGGLVGAISVLVLTGIGVISVVVPGAWSVVLMCGAFVALLALVCTQRSDVVMLGLSIGACLTIVPILASPGLWPRSLITFYIVLSVPIAWAVVQVTAAAPRTVPIWGILVALCCIPAFDNARRIYEGYSRDYPVHYANDRSMREASRAHARGETPSTVTYYKVPDTRFSEAMPWQRRDIEPWILKYYSLPAGIKFVYLPVSDLPPR